MINNILNNALNVSSRSLSEAKEKVIAASKKRATEQFGDQIPSVEFLDFSKNLAREAQSPFSSNSFCRCVRFFK